MTTPNSANADEVFFHAVQTYSKQIAKDGKSILELVTNQSVEEDVITSIKAFYQLLLGLSDSVATYSKQHADSATPPSVQQQFVSDASKQVFNSGQGTCLSSHICVFF